MRPLPILLTVLLAASTAQAADLAGAAGAALAVQTVVPEPPLVTPLEQAVSITLPRQIGKVAVGSPDLVSVVPVSARNLVVSGRKAGLTNLLVYDDANNIMYSRMIAVPATTGTSVSVYSGSTKKVLVCTPLC